MLLCQGQATDLAKENRVMSLVTASSASDDKYDLEGAPL
jgi:hypothetical protein